MGRRPPRAEKAQAGILGLQGNGFCERSDGGPVQGEKFLCFSVISPSAESLCYVSGDQRVSPDLFLSFTHIHAYIYTCIQINPYISVCMLFYFLKFFFFNVDCFKVFIEFVAILLLFHVLVFGPGACGISTP